MHELNSITAYIGQFRRQCVSSPSGKSSFGPNGTSTAKQRKRKNFERLCPGTVCLPCIGRKYHHNFGGWTIELDPFLFSLESLAEYPTFGFMFGCAYELFGMIPRICQLGRRRMMEDRRGESSSELFSQYQTLQQKIQNWEPPTPRHLDTGPEKTNLLIITARIYQKGLLIFLHSLFYISNAKDPILTAEVESIADEMFLLLEAISTRAASTMLWPIIIMGSCLRREMLVASPFI
jgi:Fungal specific transcription factor domain